MSNVYFFKRPLDNELTVAKTAFLHQGIIFERKSDKQCRLYQVNSEGTLPYSIDLQKAILVILPRFIIDPWALLTSVKYTRIPMEVLVVTADKLSSALWYAGAKGRFPVIEFSDFETKYPRDSDYERVGAPPMCVYKSLGETSRSFQEISDWSRNWEKQNPDYRPVSCNCRTYVSEIATWAGTPVRGGTWFLKTDNSVFS